MAFLATLGVLVATIKLQEVGGDKPVFTIGLSAATLVAMRLELADGIRLSLLLRSV